MNHLILSNDTKEGLTHSLTHLFERYAESEKKIVEMANFVANRDGGDIGYFLSGNCKGTHFSADKIFALEGAMNALNSEYWSKAMALTDVLECMPADDRNEWHEMLREYKVEKKFHQGRGEYKKEVTHLPKFERDTVINTLFGFMSNRLTYFAKKVDGVFRNLSSEHVTNSPMGFRKRMILARMHDGDRGYYSINHDRTNYITDLRKVIAKIMDRNLDGRVCSYNDVSRLCKEKHFGQWVEFDGGAFKMKIFKKGTAHVEVHPEIALKLNRVLATLYPEAIASEHRAKSDKPLRATPTLRTDLLSFDCVSQLDGIRSFRDEDKNVYIDKPLDETKMVLQFLGGVNEHKSGSFFKFDYDPSEAIAQIIRTGELPNIKSHQFYPTPESVAGRVHDIAQVNDGESVLEPSAGQGGLLKGLGHWVSDITCIEINDLNATILQSKGYEVIQGDFIKYKADEKFDVVIMNPPFTGKQAETHVKKAAQLLKSDGRLVAVLPASYKDKKIVSGFTHEYSEILTNEFEGTTVSVVIVEMRGV